MTIKPKQTQRGRRWLKWLFLVIVILFTAALCAVLGFHLYCRYRADKEEAQLRSEQFLTPKEEVQALYPEIPKEENAALVFEEAFKHLPPDESESELAKEVRYLPVEAQLDSELSRRIRDSLGARGECLALVRQATAMSKARFPLILNEEGWVEAAPCLDGLGRVSDVLTLNAALAADEGRPADTVRDAIDLLKLAEFLKNEPFDSSQLTRMGCIENATEVVQRLLSRQTLDDATLESLANSFNSAESSEAALSASLASQVGGMIASLNETVGNASGETEKKGDDSEDESGLVEWVLSSPSQYYFTKAYRGLREAGRLPMHLRYPAAQRAVDELEDRPFIWTVFSQLALAFGPNMYMADARSTAKARVTALSISVERYRLAHGEVPNEMDDLVPDFLDSIPVDPFDGKPLRYRHLEKGYVVYSVGTNGKDDGGAQDPDAPPKKNTRDIVFRVNR